MKLKTLVAAMAIVVGAPAFAAIAPGTTGNGELFMVVQDSVAKLSFTLDLGITMDSFIANAEALTGYNKSFSLAADANWAAFKGAADEANAVWAILAVDSTGNLQSNSQRLISTVRDGQSASINNWTNNNFTNNLGTSQGGNFFTGVNSTGTHAPANDYSVNGSSVNYETDSGRAYFGESGGLTPTFNGGGFNNTNLVGTDSQMFYVTRSGTNNATSAKVLKDPFGNVSSATMASFDGNSLMITTVPEPTTYALMLAGLAAVGLVARRRRG